MSYQRENGRREGEAVGSSSVALPAAGKRSLTGALQCKAIAAADDRGAENFHGLVSSTVGGDARQRPLQLSEASPAGGSFLDSLGARSIADRGLSGSSTALPYADQIQASFGRHRIDGIGAHVGGPAAEASAALGAHGYASGNSVAFASSPDLHTAAHEAAHVIQQRAGVHLKGGMGERGDAHEQHADAVADAVVRGDSAEALLDQYGGSGGDEAVQCSFTETRPIPGGSSAFEIDLQTRNGAPATQSGMDGYIRFLPGVGDVNSNTIAFVQIARAIDERPATRGNDIAGSAVPADRHPRGPLGSRGLRTDEDTGRHVDGGYATDVHHHLQTPGTPASPRYPFQDAPAGVTGVGTTVGPRGGTGGVMGNTPGFKRSDLPEDRKSATMYDFPGTASTALDVDIEFQSVARGEDTQHDYGSVNWGFGLRAGTVVNEHLDVVAGASATFREALDRHRDFYTHETVTIYFAFDSDVVDPAQTAKLTDLAGYLSRNPAVVMTLDGFADQIGNAAYNVDLSQRRVNNTRNALITAHPAFPAANIRANAVVAGGGHGISRDATEAPVSDTPAGTGDMGGSAAVGADQSREANRQFNRRVTINFSHPAGTGPTAPGGVASPP
jgi:outer membrane protein OmpA-like peptidoglycan-associated protein